MSFTKVIISTQFGKLTSNMRVRALVVKIFKNSTAERVQPAPIYLRYIIIPFQIDFRASAAKSDIPAVYLFGFTKLSAALQVVPRVHI